MALSVFIRSGEATPPPSITFDAPRVVIGRGEGCDVRLPDPSVSHRHASFRQRGADYLILDEGSTNGTFVGPVRLPPQTPRVVRSGDTIRVGRVWLEVRVAPVAPTQQSALATKEIALGLVAGALAAEGEAVTVRVTVAEGPDAGRELELAEFDRPYVVGRGVGAALPLTDEDVSRRHLELTRRGDRVLVRDLGSKNGATLDGEPVPCERSAPWRKGATLALGATRLTLVDPLVEALAELERAPDERMLEEEAVVPPPGMTGSPDLASAGREPHADPATPLPRTRPVAARPIRRGWQWTDTAFVLAALAVLAASLCGLYWLLSLE